MSFNNTSTARLNELIAAVSSASPGSPEDADELAEVAAGLQEIKDGRMEAIERGARYYIYGAIRHTAADAEVQNPDIPTADVKAVIKNMLEALAEDDTLLAGVMDGSVSPQAD